MTITTLGYGDIYPLSCDMDEGIHGCFARLAIISELIIGMFFLIVILAGSIEWISNLPKRIYPLTLVQLREKYEKFDQDSVL